MMVPRSFTWTLLLVTALGAPAEDGCDKSKCKGPIEFYEELSCKPLYKNKMDCCPYRFDCENFRNRSTEKCYFRGHQYSIGEQLREEDANPCDISCYCSNSRGIAGFTCAAVDCFDSPSPGCYRTRDPSECCGGPEICPERPEDLPTCEVDGHKYNAGDYFSPAGEPAKDCYCGPGYRGENIAPFCRTRSPASCGTEVHRAYEIHHNCPPVFYRSGETRISCPIDFRCQTDKDEVIKSAETSAVAVTKSATERVESEDLICKFGNLSMALGEELNRETEYSGCVRCVCEVPPMPTCESLPEAACESLPEAGHPEVE